MNKSCKYIFLVIVISFVGCLSETKIVSINSIEYEVDIPPGTVQIDSNLYIDKCEVTNINYLEYLEWSSRVLLNNEEFLNAIPDTSVWRKVLEYNAPYEEYYFRHPAFWDYPVVGVSYEQAVNYCKWRSDRVYEKILVDKGILPFNKMQNKDNYFSIERYFNGMFSDSVPIVKDIPYPEYRLPTKEEWEKAALGLLDSSYIFGYDFNNKEIIKFKKKNCFVFITKDYYEFYEKYLKYTEFDNSFLPITYVDYFLPNNYGLFNMIGNVREMIDEKGVSKGGSWMQTLYDCNIFNDIPYEEPSADLGFRCICEWKLPD